VDDVLLVMMTMEIVYTVTLSLQSHKLVAEPFLVIGIIAAIRRTLVITAESRSWKQSGAIPIHTAGTSAAGLHRRRDGGVYLHHAAQQSIPCE